MITTVISLTYAAVSLQFSHHLLEKVTEIKANKTSQPTSSSDGDERIFRHIAALVEVTIISLHAPQGAESIFNVHTFCGHLLKYWNLSNSLDNFSSVNIYLSLVNIK